MLTGKRVKGEDWGAIAILGIVLIAFSPIFLIMWALNALLNYKNGKD